MDYKWFYVRIRKLIISNEENYHVDLWFFLFLFVICIRYMDNKDYNKIILSFSFSSNLKYKEADTNMFKKI